MENHKLVLPEHLNHFGDLFGGHLLRWVDEVAWIAASLDYPGFHFVTIAMDRVEFRKSVREGAILRFETEQVHTGNTSVRYEIKVRRAREESDARSPVFSTCVTLVRVNERGEKRSLQAG